MYLVLPAELVHPNSSTTHHQPGVPTLGLDTWLTPVYSSGCTVYTVGYIVVYTVYTNVFSSV